MNEQSRPDATQSRKMWEHLEEWVREQVQRFVQTILEAEVTELLGRRKSERRKTVDYAPGSRNGYGTPRKLTLRCGTVTVRRPRRCSSNRCKKRWNVSALKVSSCAANNRPSRAQTAPKKAALLRVGAWKTTGSTSSGGTHMVQREPCCWKWHSSSNHSSTSSRAANRRSFFICPLGLRISAGDERSRLAPPKAERVEEPLALAHAELDAKLLLQVMAEHLAVPEVLGVAQLPRRTAQVLAHLLASRFGERRRPPRSRSLLQAGKTAALEALHPGVDGARALVQQVRRLVTKKSGTDQQDAHAADDRSATPRTVGFPVAPPIA